MPAKKPEADQASPSAVAKARAEISAAQAVITRAPKNSSAQAAIARKTGASWAEIGALCHPAIGPTAARWRCAGDSAAAQRATDSRLRSKVRIALIAEARVTAA